MFIVVFIISQKCYLPGRIKYLPWAKPDFKSDCFAAFKCLCSPSLHTPFSSSFLTYRRISQDWKIQNTRQHRFRHRCSGETRQEFWNPARTDDQVNSLFPSPSKDLPNSLTILDWCLQGHCKIQQHSNQTHPTVSLRGCCYIVQLQMELNNNKVSAALPLFPHSCCVCLCCLVTRLCKYRWR